MSTNSGTTWECSVLFVQVQLTAAILYLITRQGYWMYLMLTFRLTLSLTGERRWPIGPLPFESPVAQKVMKLKKNFGVQNIIAVM
jgi:hypothetical protein